jgi:ribonuclease D
MTSVDLEPPVWVDTPTSLKSMCDDMLQRTCVAVDTESNSLYAFQERVCLIQFSTPDRDYLVDPISLSDLKPLAPIFASPEIVKVFHAAEYDLICLKRDYHFQFNNIFDTMLAARILSYPAFGLGAILKEKFGLEMDKRFQKADWAKRPMPPEMLSYARMDTHYLIDLKNILQKELADRNLVGLAAEDFTRISKVNGIVQEVDPEAFWKIQGAHDLNPEQASVLRELFELRNKEARRRDQPPFKVFHNDLLLKIAEVRPQTPGDLSDCGINVRMARRIGMEILQAVKKGMQSEPIFPPKTRKCDQELKSRIEALKAWRKDTAAQYKVESDVILPRELLITIAEKQPATLEELSELMQFFPWRYGNFGEKILSVLH